nr:MAG TPA: hypothetical protein [Caudoviricetes sp.]
MYLLSICYNYIRIIDYLQHLSNMLEYLQG